MVNGTTSLDGLARTLGADRVSQPAAGEFLTDGMAPQAVVTPASAGQVAECLRYASDNGLTVIPWGGGTLMSIGNLLARHDIALDLRGLNRVLEHEPADLTVTAEAGITLAALQEHLAIAGQFLPLDAPLSDRATIGGRLATDSRGAWEGTYGSARDWLIGLRVVTPDGRLTRVGGKVVKNVAGYDLCKLYTGSFGTLGVIVEATFKVAPLPKRRKLLALVSPDVGTACRLTRELQKHGLSLESAELFLGPAETPRLFLGLAGTPAGVERSLAEARSLAAESGCHETQAVESARPAGELVCRLSCQPARLPQIVDALAAISPAPRLLARPLSGAVIAAWADGSEAQRLWDEVSSLDANAVARVCPVELKRSIDVFGATRADFELMRRIKQQFDPAGVLNPGRFLGGL
ncbi:MAG TPA: FAD-binding oxidoreductase [Dehalococcoidia bacterium]|nr:FAD-binding oxidoreductase [Dehalococcoidia bacterium]